MYITDMSSIHSTATTMAIEQPKQRDELASPMAKRLGGWILRIALDRLFFPQTDQPLPLPKSFIGGQMFVESGHSANP